MRATLLAMFAKFWQPGQVKTRLAAAVGDQPASEVYRASIDALLSRFEKIADGRELVYWPPERREEFSRLVGEREWRVRPQCEGDLGARMAHYFTEAFAARHHCVVLIGSDAPTLPRECVEEAFELLHRHSVVLGPSDDGGYYLVGLAGRVPPIFEGIPWSSAEVWSVTVARLAAAGIDFAVLPPWYDLDELPDLQRLAAELDRTPERGPELTALREMVYAALGET
jgi:rSAM/selenodomain-associated transferase 1